MALRKFATEGKRVQASVEGGPSAEVLIGVDDQWPMGAANIVIPAGGGMPEHEHGVSATLLVPIDGTVILIDTEGGEELEIGPGAVATIPVSQRVAVENRSQADVLVIAVFDPPDFTEQLKGWAAAAVTA